MPIKDPEIIKNIVRGNFDKSPEHYEQFEERFGVFEYLTKQLAEVCNIQEGITVCDIGCGTGTSSFVLKSRIGPKGMVVGVDFSLKMLEVARAKLNASQEPNLKFIQCDANALEENIDFEIDMVLYNACIFLIPEPINTFKSAYNILAENGTIGMNYLIGLFDTSTQKNPGNKGTDEDLFAIAKLAGTSSAPYGRRITDCKILPSILYEVGFRNIREGVLFIELSLDEMKAFYRIPAQSSALWPKNTYEGRLSLLDSLIEYFQQNNIKTFYQHWGWCVGEK